MSVPPTGAGALLKIGEVCQRVGLSIRTVRYYEEVGLLTPTDRSPGGFRLYSEDDVRRLEVLKGMKPFGLTLEEIRELMALLDGDTPGTPGEVRAALTGYAARADARIAQLDEHANEVRRLRARILAAAGTAGTA